MHISVRLALIAGSAAWALSGAPQAGAAWTAPVKVSAADVTASAPEAGIDDAGNLTVVWVSGSAARSIRSAFRPAGGDWETSFARMPTSFDCHDPKLAVNPAGAAVVVADCGTGAATMRAAYRAAGGFWAGSVVLPGSGSGSEPRVGIDDAGNAVVVWSSAGTVKSAYRPAAGGWTGPTQVSPAGDVTLEPQLAMSPTGVAQAIWRHERRDNSTDPVVRVEASSRHGSAPWTTAQELTLPDTDTVPVAEDEPQVRFNGLGNKVAVWANRTTPERAILQKTSGFSTNWGGGGISPVQNASDGATSVEAPQVALDDQGRAVAVWRSYNGTGRRTQASTTTSLSGTWSAPVILADVETGFAEPQVAAAPGGNAAAVWRTSSASISAATRPAAGVFQPATTISSIDNTGSSAPRVVMSTAGDAIAAWSESTTGATRIAVSVDDLTPPALSAISVPAGVEAGTAAAMSAAAADAWSPVTLGWNLGDGTTVAGDAISHTYAAAGTRTVTVTATDAAGNAATATREIVVTQTPAGGTGPGDPPPGGGDPGGGDPGGGGPASTPVTLGVAVPKQSWRAIRKAKAVRLRCSLDVPGACDASATVTRSVAKRLRLKLGKRAQTLRVGAGQVTIARGGTATRLKIALGRKARRAIGRARRRVKLTLTVTGSAPGRGSTTLTRRFTIRRR